MVEYFGEQLAGNMPFTKNGWQFLDESSKALEKSGIKIIQIDEPAIREGLPLRKADQQDYLNWAVRAFRVSSSNVDDDTQIHTHMCYSEFNDIIEDIAAMDADVITIETSRSQMELLDAFAGDFNTLTISDLVYTTSTLPVYQAQMRWSTY
ncbi:hypothetical protein FQR65_LT19372 [Abscondita terminalis]|nr:hypothetical protein FQR65_LT19372 [Abscondita terminalis]